jgi:arylsulfatase A-like enzyme
MIAWTADSSESGSVDSSPPDPAANRRELVALVCLSAWCGLVAGLFEVGTIVLRKQLFDPDRLYAMSRYFVGLIPVTNLCLFLALGCFGCIASLAKPHRGRWVLARLLCAFTFLPILLVAFPRIYSLAWFVLALGAAVQLVPLCLRNARAFRRFIQVSFPMVLGLVLILGASPWLRDRWKRARAGARPLPPPGSANVLLIVLDTVAAGHLSLYGYNRPTSTTLAELAQRGICFDSAMAPSSWTLPSHATMFTGRWHHELSVGWLTPLDETRPTLAEYLGARGYATAGFVANSRYCGSDSGLGRGFTLYEDYFFPKLTASRTAVLVERALLGIDLFVNLLNAWLKDAPLKPALGHLRRLFVNNRKEAAVINREFLDWLSQRTQPERPFLAFLNYVDAHAPYRLPPGGLHRFGVDPTGTHRDILIQYWWTADKTRVRRDDLAFAADAYDDCIADLDERLGRLYDELNERGVLERTWLVITSDHGESFGEHAWVFCHGSSLYQTELHVPLLIIPPGGSAPKQVVRETVSLRDIAATIVDVLGLEAGSPFPGSSLARFWNTKEPSAKRARASCDPALAEVLPNDRSNRDSAGLPKKRWPLAAVIEDDWSYIRHGEEHREELFHLRADAKEQRNLAGDPAAVPTLERMRAALDGLTAGPLVPQRFNR